LTETLAGTPTAAGSFTFELTVTNGTASDPQSYVVDITAAGVLTITTTSVASGTNGTLYNASIASVGGTGAHSWLITSGTLPTGLTLGSSTTASVSISGTPTQTGSFPITVQVTDSSGPPQNDTQLLTIVISAGGGGPGGPISGGGGGGGGGCAAADSSSTWMLALGLLAMFGFALRMRARRE
jgi:hypothetical protein